MPEGWADFFDTTKIPGKRGVWDYSEGGMFEIALMADEVAPTDLYPLDLAAGHGEARHDQGRHRPVGRRAPIPRN